MVFKNFLVKNTSKISHHGCGKVTPSKIKIVSCTWWLKSWIRKLWCLVVFPTRLSTGKNNKLQCLWEVDLIFSWFHRRRSWVLSLYWLTMLNLKIHDQGGIFYRGLKIWARNPVLLLIPVCVPLPVHSTLILWWWLCVSGMCTRWKNIAFVFPILFCSTTLSKRLLRTSNPPWIHSGWRDEIMPLSEYKKVSLSSNSCNNTFTLYLYPHTFSTQRKIYIP